MAEFNLKIVTPDGICFDGTAVRIVVRTTNGDVGIMARHANYVAPLSVGEARVTDKDGKVVVAKTDCAVVTVTFDTKGVATVDTTAEIKTKLDLGKDYGMAAAINYGPQNDPNGDGKVLEWFEQAAAFDAALVGKTASEFASLADADGKGTGDLATAGCTIGISDMIKAADKAAK